MEATQQTPHIVMVPTPGMGHLIPSIELAKKLILYNNISITYLISNDGSSLEPQKEALQALPKSINAIFLPPVSFDDLPEGTKIETRIVLTLIRSLPSLREAFKDLKERSNITAMVADLFATEAFEVAQEFGVLPFLFYTSAALDLSSMFYLPKLDETYSGEYIDLPEPLKLPGCIPFQARDLVDTLHDRQNEAYKWLLHAVKRYRMADGIILNSFTGLEPGACKALNEDWPGFPPVYPVGPLIRTISSREDEDGSECLKWLNQQPRGSVLFISFGSGGTLSHEQLLELAYGLEMSGQRFLWAVRSPHDLASSGAFFTVKSAENPFYFLPDGFIERTKDLGLVVSSWVPQIKILNHSSTGGFLTHCGWNSTLESVVHGIPLIAWPLFAEQRQNAVLLSEDLKVAVRVQANEKVVGREQIAGYVKGLIEGDEGKMLRKRMEDLKEAAAMAMEKDGSSTRLLAEIAQILSNNRTI
ncbi:UDP-glucuronosyl/UDP-glucosyltransferase [Dillenia turbinata]|uniref:Glycosyltransferase n=1 Tax=Dillenia turbinata TaxID=194707 RepID=A0AAN8WGC2_9MAGN